jgi:T5SS/PEP-CTERM-associated repeat protein
MRLPDHRLGRVLAWAIFPFACLVLARSAAGATVDWVGHLVLGPPIHHTYDGTFSDGPNWSTGSAPGAGDTAEFNAAANYTVTFSNSPTNSNLIVSGGGVTFASAMGLIPTYFVSGAGITADLTLSDFQLNSTGAVSVGGSSGSLTVMSDAQGSGAAQLVSGNLSVVSAVGLGNSSALTVTGPRAFITQSGAATLSVGSFLASSGLVHVDGGGKFTSGTGAIQVNRTGTINLTGGTFLAKGSMTVDGGLLEGDSLGSFTLANGKSLTLQDGGRTQFASFVKFGGNTVTVDGATSRFNNSSYTYVGSGGLSSTMTWQNGATGTLGGLFVGGTTDPNSQGTVIIQSGASVTSDDTGIGNFNLTGQSGTMTVTGSGSTFTANGPGGFAIGGFVASGNVFVNSGGVMNTTTSAFVGPTGHLNITAGMYNASASLGVRGSLQSDPAGAFTLAAGQTLAVSAGGHVDLNGAVTLPGAAITLDGTGSHLNMANALSLGD